MILYVNGDSHSAGAEAVNAYSFANDDSSYWKMGREPHPDNLKASYGCLIANQLGAVFDCDAQSASSNDRIIRTTREYLKNNTPDFIIIGWTSWEREEWEYEGVTYQVSGWCSRDWPQALKDKHKDWVINVDYNQKRNYWHDQIWQFHNELTVPHIFFNAFSAFSRTPILDWNNSYIDPYDDSMTYRNWLSSRNYKTVNPDSYHFGADGHRAWAEFLLPKVLQNKR